MKPLLPLFISCGILSGVQLARADVTIVAQGKSTFRITLPPDAPTSLQEAARELQKDIHIATGALLPISDNVAVSTSGVISLGNTRQAQQAGIGSQHLAPEGFRIVTKNDNIYIIGPDTPDGSFTKEGGASNGTANGVYTFLEKYLDVRWLMPGELGRDVPRKSTFKVPDINCHEAPFLLNRRAPYMQNSKPAVEQWETRQKLGYSFRINHSHNWTQTITPNFYTDHPDWFAMRDGERIPPKGNYKVESTNSEVVQKFADKAIASLKAHPETNTFSLSPSDGRGWSESPESKAWYDPAPAGSKHPSVTPMILKFYNEVAQRVSSQLPHAKLAGYIYADYLYPPQKGGMKLPDNFYPVIAPSIDYGYKLYREDTQRDFDALLSEWSKVTPHLFFYDLPNRLRQNAGLVTPMAPEILNFIFPRLVKNNVKGVYIYAIDSWSQAAMNNYVLAKMMWNPQLDATQLQREWLHRAYGKAAGTKMESMYQHLDRWFRVYYRTHSEASYVLTMPMFKGIYGAHYPQLESLYLQAARQPMTPAQQQRLELIGDNIAVLQWRLRNNNLLPADFRSQLPSSDAEIARILAKPGHGVNRYPGMMPDAAELPALSDLKIQQVRLTSPLPSEKSTFVLPNDNTFLIHAAQDGVIRMTPLAVEHGDWALTYMLRNKNVPAQVVASGLLVAGQTVEFSGRAGEDYYLSFPPFNYTTPRSGMSYQVQIHGAAIAKSTFDASSKTLLMQKSDAPVYIYGNAKSVFADHDGAIVAAASSLNILKRKFTEVRDFDLTKQWHFLPDAADGENVAAPTFDASSWKTIDAGNWWQRSGFPDYYGIAWYRKAISLPALQSGQKVMLHFDAVDGNAEVYFNGNKIGKHTVDKDFSGWDEPFWFDVTDKTVPGNNVIAVQVTSKSRDTASGIQQPVHLLIGNSR